MRKNAVKCFLSVFLVICTLIFPINTFAYSDAPAQWAKEAVVNSFFYEIAYSGFIGSFDKEITREEFAMIAVNVYRIVSGKEPDVPTEYTFTDISSSQYKNEIQTAKDLGIVKGTNTAQTLFSPSNLVTRQEICLMIFRLLQIIDPDYDYTTITENPFSDRSQIASWAIDAVDFAYNEGIMNGTSTSLLRISPADNTTREQGMTLVYRMMVNWKYISSVSQKLLDEINITSRSITIGSKDYLEDYLRDSVMSRKRDIRIWLSNGLTKTDIDEKLTMIRQEFEDIGYYYVPEISSYTIELFSPIYVITVKYGNNTDTLPDSLICAAADWDAFDEWFMLQVRSGVADAAYDLGDVSMRSLTIIRDRIKALLNTNLDLNYVTGYQIMSSTGNPQRYLVGLEFAYTPELAKAYLSQAREFAGNFIKVNIRPGMTAMEKEIIINDFIVSNTKYYLGTDAQNDVYYDYGVFFNNEAVCQGYAAAVKLLLNMTGIYSINIIGTGNGQAHAWNLVKLYGEYYHLDTTWNDPVPDVAGRLRYDYLNVTQTEILKNHTISTLVTYPAANGTRYNYYTYIGAVFNTQTQVVDYMKDRIGSGVMEFSFKISNYTLAGYNISDLIRQAVSDLGISSYSAVFSINSDLGVINIKIN